MPETAFNWNSELRGNVKISFLVKYDEASIQLYDFIIFNKTTQRDAESNILTTLHLTSHNSDE